MLKETTANTKVPTSLRIKERASWIASTKLKCLKEIGKRESKEWRPYRDAKSFFEGFVNVHV